MTDTNKPATNVTVKTRANAASYDIAIGCGLVAAAGAWAARVLPGTPGRAAIISNRKVFGLYGGAVKKGLENAGFEPHVHLIGDGERFKSLRTLESTLGFLSGSKLTRTDSVIALGGGVVGDLAGFAASIYLRGISFLQIPTTLLSMIDSSVGGKTGVNSSFGKNLIGSFYQPHGVLIDTATLATLPAREVTAGFCEAIKQGAIGGRPLLDRTSAILEKLEGDRLKVRLDDYAFSASFSAFLAAQVSFKARIVAGDERESTGKTDARSRKVLNFGHTFGHALEKATNYRYFRHGEAVGHGIRFAAALSKNLELLGQNDVELLNDVVRRAGGLPAVDKIDPGEIFATLQYDKKMINDSLQWVLLERIGKPVIFPHAKIPRAALAASFKQIISG
ncbi:MAG: 3-dehydroquinate synthase [Acidobacteria bacterium]|nr:3-dehydroquinate synthase [Acidobacteriota bacterium]